MKAGGLISRLIPMELISFRDPVSGTVKKEWVNRPVIRADRAKLIGRRRSANGETVNAYDAEFRVRIGHKVSDGWRVREVEGYLYEVAATEKDRLKQMKTLKCFKVDG